MPLAASALLLIASGSGSAARAQGTGILPLRLKAGIFTPQDQTTRDLAGHPLYVGEADLSLPSPSGGSGHTFISVGYQEKRSNGNLLRVVPLTVARVFALPNPAATVTGNIYYGIGAGAYVLRATKDGSSQSATRPGGFGMVGYQLPGSFFAEAKYQLVGGSVRSAKPSGLVLMIGRHL